MTHLLVGLYQCVAVPFMWFATTMGQFVHPKMRLRAKGISATQRALRKRVTPGESWAWFHAASYGEFEQIRSVIRELKQRRQSIKVCVSFTSPSGYEKLHTSDDADLYVYIPTDTPRAAKRFLNTLRPTIAVFSRYDVWYNHLRVLKHLRTHIVLVSATLPDSLQSSTIARLWKQLCLSYVSHIFAAGESEQQKFNALHLATPTEISKDPRIDRILSIVDHARRESMYTQLFANEEYFRHTIVVGSSWPAEESIVQQCLDTHGFDNIRWILVPHEPTTEHVAELLRQFPSAQTLSEIELQEDDNSGPRVVIVDSVGKLLWLYSCASAVFVGGGFGKGVHSVLEPAGYGVPLCSGPAIERARDAIQLQDRAGLRVIHNADDLSNWIRECVQNETERARVGNIALCYLEENAGATDQVVDYLEHQLRLKDTTLRTSSVTSKIA